MRAIYYSENFVKNQCRHTLRGKRVPFGSPKRPKLKGTHNPDEGTWAETV